MRALVLGLALSLLVAAPAAAENVTIAGSDEQRWDKPNVGVKPGDTVTWTFANTTQAHNVKADGSDPADATWAGFRSTLAVAAPDASYTFQTAGLYKFVCEVHSGMTGTVKVGDGTAFGEVLPLSRQEFRNDQTAALPLERVDEDKDAPLLSAVSARRVARGALRVRFRVSEQSVVEVRLRRGRALKTVSADAAELRGVNVRQLHAGRYRIEVRATDLAGNRSAWRKVSLTVR